MSDLNLSCARDAFLLFIRVVEDVKKTDYFAKRYVAVTSVEAARGNFGL